MMSSEVAANMLGSSTAAIISRFICHPIDTIKSRVQTSTISPRQILNETLNKEGWRALFKGVGPVLLGGVPGVCMYLTTYEYTKNKLLSQSTDKRISPFLIYMLSALTAETCCCLVFVPVDVLKERMQIDRNSTSVNSSGWSTARSILIDEGIIGFYRGYAATLASYGPFACLYFVLYEKFKAVVASSDGEISFTKSLYTSALAGAIASAATSPLDMVKLRLQVQRQRRSSVSPVSSFSYRGMIDGLRQVLASEGVRGLFRGMGTRVLFHTPSTALTMALFETCKRMWLSLFGGDKRRIEKTAFESA